jgi:thymidylate synthase
MNQVDNQYKKLIQKILNNGHNKNDRTGTGTKSIFGHQLRYNMNDGFPLLTLRKIHTKSLIHEMLWFLSAFDKKYNKFGNTNIRYLIENGVNYWNDWPYDNYLKKRKYRVELPYLTKSEFIQKILKDDNFAIEFGTIGKGYGHQWLKFGSGVEYDNEGKKYYNTGINQIDYIIQELKKKPDSRRLILESWKADEINDMILPPCHHGFQMYSFKKDNKRYLSLKLHIRSNDIGLGNPYNVAQYALLLHLISHIVNMIPYELIVDIGDAHIYNNHIEQLKEILKRESFKLPNLNLNKNIKSIYDFRFNDIIINNYKYHPNIKMEVSI